MSEQKDRPSGAACPCCHGSGIISERPCSECHGTGSVQVAYDQARREAKRLREALGEMRDVAAAMARVIAAKGCVEELERELREAGIPDGFGARAEAFLRGEEAR